MQEFERFFLPEYLLRRSNGESNSVAVKICGVSETGSETGLVKESETGSKETSSACFCAALSSR